MAKQTEKSVLQYLYDYQTRLQGVANDLATKLVALVLKTDDELVNLMVKELPKRHADLQEELRRMKHIVAALEKIRRPTYDAAKDLVFETSASVIQKASSQTVREIMESLNKQRALIRQKRFASTLTEKQQKAILNGQGIDGSTIAEWFGKWERADLERITSICKRASVEQMSVVDVVKAVRGTEEGRRADGILAATRTGAVTVARTIINGVSNNARVETIKENSDVVDGVKFIGTLDGKTCPYCAPYDGQIWRGEDIATARRPPIHPNCRCTLVPYVELRDADGNPIEVESDRPAANADFDKIAEDAYNAQAREKGWTRRWGDLSAGTRLKYYYQAQKNYEEQTGKPAYRQVSSSLSFADYFKAQPEEFKRSWLGKKRYELYSKGTVDEKTIFSPDLSFRKKTADLEREDTIQEAEQISVLAEQELKEEPTLKEKSKESQEPETKKLEPSPGDVKIPTREQLPSKEDLNSRVSDSSKARADAIQKARRFQAPLNAEIEALRKRFRSTPNYQTNEEYLKREKEIFAKWERLAGAEMVEQHTTIHKSTLDVLLPVDTPDSGNRKFSAAQFDDRLATAGLPEELRDQFNRTFRSALDFSGRICDNLGVDMEKTLGRVRFVIDNTPHRRGATDTSQGRVTIYLNLEEFKKTDVRGCEDMFKTIVHEIGHAVEDMTGGAQELIDELRDDITTDANGNQTPIIQRGENESRDYDLQAPTLSVPRLYSTRRYSSGGTEITSTYFEQLAINPSRYCHETEVSDATDWRKWDTKTTGCQEYYMRVTDVYREAMRFDSDKQALLDGSQPKEIIAILDSCIARLNNATSAEEVKRLSKEISVRTEAWAKIKDATIPARQDFDSRKEHEKAVASYNSLIREAEDKLKEVRKELKRKRGEFGVPETKTTTQKTRMRLTWGNDVLADSLEENENKPRQEGTISSPEEPRPFDSIVPSYRGKFVADDLIPIWSEMTYLQLLSKEEPALQKAEKEWEKKANLAEPEKGTDEHEQWATVKEAGAAFWADAATIRELLCDDKQKLLWKAENAKSPFPDKNTVFQIAKTLNGETLNDETPEVEWKDSNGNSYKVTLAGSTSGSMILECPDGNKFIMKRGSADDKRLKNECAADDFYRACGVRVPEPKLYTDSQGGLVKLSRFIENVVPLKDWMVEHHMGDAEWLQSHPEDSASIDLMRKKLRENFAVDVLIGNWDVVGGWGRNIVVDQNGDPWRVDNGSAFSSPAREGSGNAKKKKDASEWGGVDKNGNVNAFVDDLWTMTGNGARIGKANRGEIANSFGNYDVLEIADQIDALQGTKESKEKLEKALDALGENDREIIKKRLKEVHQLSVRGNDSLEAGYTRDFTLQGLDVSYDCSKDGFREACQFRIDPEKNHYGWFRRNGTYAPQLVVHPDFVAIKETIEAVRMKFGTEGIPKGTKDETVQEALSLSKTLKKAKRAGAQNVDVYIQWLDLLADRQKNGGLVPRLKETPDITIPAVHDAPLTQDKRYPCFWDYFEAKMGKEALKHDSEVICTHGTGAFSSGNTVFPPGSPFYGVRPTHQSACEPKILELGARGLNVRDYIPKKEDLKQLGEVEREKAFEDAAHKFLKEGRKENYFLGNEKKRHARDFQYENCHKEVVKFMKSPDEYNQRLRERATKQAVITLILENVEHDAIDRERRTIRVVRTESPSILKNTNVGTKCTLEFDPHGSCSVEYPYVAKATDPVVMMAEVPFSCVKDIYWLQPGEENTRLRGGDVESEIIVDLNGAKAVFIVDKLEKDVKRSRSDTPAKDYYEKFEEYKKRSS